jgi:Kunitz/Bovine pancreatic trypsin inhibitor domain
MPYIISKNIFNLKTDPMKNRKLFLSLFMITMFVVFPHCIKSDRCNLIPDTGPCLAIFKRYYYDSIEKKCKEFNWGGCGGVVPFDTKSDCEKQCNCK